MSEAEPDQPLTSDPDVIWLQRELSEAHKTVRTLLRQLTKEQQRHAETVRAYDKTVANLVEAARENAALQRDRDRWKLRAEGTEVAGVPFKIGGLTLDLTPAEVSAIRKAMARLHHPDAGGDAERMKAWNSALDPLEG